MLLPAAATPSSLNWSCHGLMRSSRWQWRAAAVLPDPRRWVGRWVGWRVLPASPHASWHPPPPPCLDPAVPTPPPTQPAGKEEGRWRGRDVLFSVLARDIRRRYGTRSCGCHTSTSTRRWCCCENGSGVACLCLGHGCSCAPQRPSGLAIPRYGALSGNSKSDTIISQLQYGVLGFV
jgi:hypothetical protein